MIVVVPPAGLAPRRAARVGSSRAHPRLEAATSAEDLLEIGPRSSGDDLMLRKPPTDSKSVTESDR